jgi:hypothetical protein
MLDHKPAPAEPGGEITMGRQQAGLRGFHGAAPLADDMVVVPVGKPEVRDPAEIELLDEPGRMQPLEDAVRGHLAKAARGATRARPNGMAGGHVLARGQHLQNAEALGRDAQPSPVEHPGEATGIWHLRVSSSYESGGLTTFVHGGR